MCSPCVSYVVVAVAAAVVGGARGHSFAGLRGKDAGVLCQNTFHYSLASKPPQTGKSPFAVVAHLPKYIPGKNLQGRKFSVMPVAACLLLCHDTIADRSRIAEEKRSHAV